MTFDDDVLSAIEEAFGTDSASLMDDLEAESAEDFSPEDLGGESSLEDLVGRLDREILETVHKELGGNPQKRRADRSKTSTCWCRSANPASPCR